MYIFKTEPYHVVHDALLFADEVDDFFWDAYCVAIPDKAKFDVVNFPLDIFKVLNGVCVSGVDDVVFAFWAFDCAQSYTTFHDNGRFHSTCTVFA